MKYIDEMWTDFDGRKHKRYTVRSLGAGRGYCPFDRLGNYFLWANPDNIGATRQQAWDWLRERDRTDAVRPYATQEAMNRPEPEQFDHELAKRNLATVKQFGTLYPTAEQLEELFDDDKNDLEEL